MKKLKKRLGILSFLAISAALLVSCGGGGGGGGGEDSYTLTIIQPDASNGTIVADPPQTTFAAGETVTLSATPASGKDFTGWTNGASGTTNPLVLTMNRNITVGANFVSTYTVTASSGNASLGSVSVSPVKTVYRSGESVTVTATPTDGNVFVTWSGDLSGSENPRTFAVTKNTNITATFAPDTQPYALTVNVSPSGSGTVTLSSGSYPGGTEIPVDATPSRGYRFTGYQLSAGGSTVWSSSQASATMTMPAEPATLTATFEALPEIVLSSSVSPASSGTCTIVHSNSALAGQPFYQGDIAKITYTPSRGYSFGGFSSGAWTSATNPATYTVGSGNATITATSTAITPLTVTAVTNDSSFGTVSISGATAPYYPGDNLTFTVNPASGYIFTGWSGASTSTNASVSLTLAGNTSLTANLRQPRLTVNITGGAEGTLGFSPAGTSVSTTATSAVRGFTPGTSVTVTAPVVTGYTFHQWTRNGTHLSYDTAVTRTVSVDDTLAAVYVRNQWTIMVYMDGDNDLEPFAIADFNEMEAVDLRGSGINVITLFDRGTYDNTNGDWQGTRLMPVKFDDDTINTEIISESVASSELGLTANGNEELNMGDPANIEGFIAASKRLAQADNYMFVLWNHGTGWRKAASDLPVKSAEIPSVGAMRAIAQALPVKQAAEKRGSYKAVCIDETDGDMLMTAELGTAFADKDLDVIGFDLCLGGMIEVAYEIRNCASYMIASPELTPGDGWEYDQWLANFKAKSVANRTGLGLGKSIVDTFATRYADTTGAVLAVYDLSRVGMVVSYLSIVSSNITSYISSGTSPEERWANRNKVYNALYNYTEDYYVPDGDLNLDLGYMAVALYNLVYTSANTTQRANCNSLYNYITNTSSGLVAYLWKNATTGTTGNPNSTGIAIHFAALDGVDPAGHNSAYFSDHETAFPGTTLVPSFVDNVTQWCPLDTSSTSSGVLGYLFYASSLY